MIKDTNSRFIITMDTKKKEKIRQIAEAKNRTMSNMVVHILDEYLKRNGYE